MKRGRAKRGPGGIMWKRMATRTWWQLFDSSWEEVEEVSWVADAPGNWSVSRIGSGRWSLHGAGHQNWFGSLEDAMQFATELMVKRRLKGEA